MSKYRKRNEEILPQPTADDKKDNSKKNLSIRRTMIMPTAKVNNPSENGTLS